MVTWTDAHRIANIAAAQAHHDLEVDTSAPPIDVAAALARDDVPLMWRPMPRLFGAYLNSPDSRPGVLVNCAIPTGARRHTAAHELGHHRLRHSATIDDGACLHVDPLETSMGIPPRGRPQWTDQEKAAEAFAAWFLMPRRAVDAAMRLRGVTRLETATQVYQMSLILGTSYRSTARHLPNLRLASHDRARMLMTEIPGRIKTRLDPTRSQQGRGTSDVWLVDRHFDGTQIIVQPGDQVVAHVAPGHQLTLSGDPCLDELQGAADPGGGEWKSWVATPTRTGCHADAEVSTFPADTAVTEASDTNWRVTIVLEAPPTGIDRNWLSRTELPR